MFVGKKNEEFSFSAKLMPKLVCLANAVVLEIFFFFIQKFKCRNHVYGFEFDSIAVVLDNDI